MGTQRFKMPILAAPACALALALVPALGQAPPSPVPISAAGPQWVNNHGARLVIGQSSFTRQDPISSREALGAAQGVAFAGNRLFVADGNRLGD